MNIFAFNNLLVINSDLKDEHTEMIKELCRV